MNIGTIRLDQFVDSIKDEQDEPQSQTIAYDWHQGEDSTHAKDLRKEKKLPVPQQGDQGPAVQN